MGIQDQTSPTNPSTIQHIEKCGTLPSPSSPPSWHFPMPASGRPDHVHPSQRLSRHLSQKGILETGTPCMRHLCPTQHKRTPATVTNMGPSLKESTTSACT